MKSDPTNLLEIACIKTPLIGLYDVRPKAVETHFEIEHFAHSIF